MTAVGPPGGVGARMASKRSAGLILHRRNADGEIEVLLVHPGGPFWAGKDAHAWSIPKGEYDEGDDAETVALREFEEELGSPPPDGSRLFLGEFGQSSRKRISAWALEGDFAATHAVSNTFELEWPPGSGQVRVYPEVDKAAWWTIDSARTKLHKPQAPLLDALAEVLKDDGDETCDTSRAVLAQRARLSIRAGEHTGPTAHLAPGCVQANLVVLPRAVASDFVTFASRNPKPCPIVEVVERGTETVRCAPDSDLRTDVPRYRLFVDGIHADSATDATSWWRDDLVAVLLGCSFTFEAALMRAGLPVRHIEQACNVPMYVTDRQCEARRGLHRPAGGVDAAHARGDGRAGPTDHRGLPASPRRSGPCRRPSRAEHLRPERPGLRRPRGHPRRRGVDVLGLRGHPATGHRQRRPRDRDHPRARPHVHHRPARRSDNPGNKRRVGSLSTRILETRRRLCER